MQKMIFAFITAAAAVMLISPLFIPMLRRLKYGQVERAEGPHAHSAKEGTPTMGGIMFIIAIIIAVAAFSIYGIAFDFSVPAVLIMLAFGLVGFLDDFIKVKRKRNLGLRAYQKIIAQLLLSFAAAYYAYKSSFIGSTLYDPIFGSIAMGVLFLYFAKVFDGSFINEPRFVANRDGMLCMSVFAFAVAGGCLGFLKSNSYPAKVFMGDTGSMALGGAMSAMVIYSRSPFLFLLMGVCIVASAVSVVLQVGSFKLRHGKRIFKMAPLHHHFELLGYPETKVVSGYMIVTALACVAALALFL